MEKKNANKPVFNRTFNPDISSNNLDQKLRFPTFYILSIDGGGARGIIPAVILKEIERRSGRRIPELFDRICGTSTGSILACEISAPKSSGNTLPMFHAREIVEIYRALGPEIFSRGSFNETVMQPIDNLINGEISIAEALRPIASITQALDTLSSVWSKINAPLHDVQKLAYLLHGYLGDLEMKDALTELFVYAYDIGSRTPEVLGSTESSIPGQTRNYSKFHMYQTATGSSAAVPFFAPYTVWKKPNAPWMVDVPMRSEFVYPDPGGSGDSFDLIDGGNGGLV